MTEPVSSIQVQRWPTEIPLLILVSITSAVLWLVIFLSLIGIIYALILGVIFFLGHVGFIAWVRGNAVKLGPGQFPELHDRVNELSSRIGIRRPPDAYIMQAGGALNALATKFLRSDFIILFSDLIEACGENTQARDMIVAHELGHLKAGHLRWMWLLLPGYFVPFLGAAWSRAREYTADRYGIAACSDRAAGVKGMSILAAGGRCGPGVNLEALVAQSGDLDTGWMTLGTWLASHPPLARRIAAMAPETSGALSSGRRGTVRALAGIAGLVLLVLFSSAFAMRKLLPAFKRQMEEAQAMARTGAPLSESELRRRREQAEQDMRAIASFLDVRRSEGPLPSDPNDLHDLWRLTLPDVDFPRDPFDGKWYGYALSDDTYVLWAAGENVNEDVDDIVYDSEIQGFR